MIDKKCTEKNNEWFNHVLEKKKNNKKNKRGDKFIPILTAETVNLF